MRTLDEFGFEWDGVTLQSERTARYEAALESLHARQLTFECSCSRSQLADEDRYPGHCRAGPSARSEHSRVRSHVPTTATRLRVDPGKIQFTDRIQGAFRQDVAAAVGDFVLCRRDRLFAYVMAVVVDDAEQGITHVIRGADLLDNTPRQIYLQRLLGYPSPMYAHVPLLTEADGRKLAKSRRSAQINSALPQLLQVFDLLGLSPTADVAGADLQQAWDWAVHRWRIEAVPKRLAWALSV